jgi:hypothetical protein
LVRFQTRRHPVLNVEIDSTNPPMLNPMTTMSHSGRR